MQRKKPVLATPATTGRRSRVFPPKAVYATNSDPERVFQAVRDPLCLHPEQLAGDLDLKPAVFEVEVTLEALRVEGEVLP
jgi:hypothetical protein